jgi:hypothetical protein
LFGGSALRASSRGGKEIAMRIVLYFATHGSLASALIAGPAFIWGPVLRASSHRLSGCSSIGETRERRSVKSLIRFLTGRSPHLYQREV